MTVDDSVAGVRRYGSHCPVDFGVGPRRSRFLDHADYMKSLIEVFLLLVTDVQDFREDHIKNV